MPKLAPNAVPAYRLHKQSGQAIVTLNGRDVTLGRHGSADSRDRYNRLIGEWIANGRRPLASLVPAPSAGAEPAAAVPGNTVSVVIAAYWAHAQTYYAGSGELAATKSALGVLRRLYGPTAAEAFGPLALKSLRESMIRAGWCRNYVNAQVNRIRRVFKWATENELVTAAVWNALRAVAGLRQGKTTARETSPVRPAPAAAVEAVLAHLSPVVRAMVELQDLTGMRSTEVCTLRACDVDTSGPTWVYRPASHKTAHHGHAREIPLGPRARQVLEPLLKAELTAFVFAPADAVADRRDRDARERVTPAGRGNGPGTNRQKRPRRTAGERYTKDSYARAVARACDRAFPPPAELQRRERESERAWMERLTAKQLKELKAWRRKHRFHPHQLRHGGATRARAACGVEGAQAILGHRSLKVTEVYAERSGQLAAEVAGRIG